MQTITRRSFAAGFSMAVGAAPVAGLAMAHPGRTEIEATAQCCNDARHARDTALAAYERALPPPHFTIDLTEPAQRRGFSATVERRLFDGKTPKRVINPFGIPAVRFVATAETIEQDRWRYASDRRRRRLLYRMRRRAKARAAKIATLEASFRLEKLQRASTRPSA